MRGNIIQARVNTIIIEHRIYKLILIEVQETTAMIMDQVPVVVWFLERVRDLTLKIKAWNPICAGTQMKEKSRMLK